MRYRVHVYMTVRVPFDDIEAESQQAAIKIVQERAATECMTLRDMADLEAEPADEITGFLVDEEGDDEYERSGSYDGEGQLMGAATEAAK